MTVCKHCGYEWEYGGKLLMATCPSCKHKVSTTINYLDLKPTPKIEDFDQLWKALETYQEKSRLLSTHQEDITVEIKEDNPILISFLADMHIGAVSGKYKELKERVDLLSSTEHCYIVSCGDTIDNFLPSFHPQGQFGVLCPPEVQKKLAEYILQKLEGKILTMVQGTHEEPSHETDDFDWTKYLTEKFGCANLGFGGFMHIKLGSQEYTLCIRHQYRFNSALNLTHTVKRMREQLGDFDVGVVAHNHQAAIEEIALSPEKTAIFIRPGSFKGADRYARMLGFVDTGTQIPSVILFPKEKKMLPFLNLKDATTVLVSLLEA